MQIVVVPQDQRAEIFGKPENPQYILFTSISLIFSGITFFFGLFLGEKLTGLVGDFG